MKFICYDRNYKKWDFLNEKGERVRMGKDFCPLKEKLLNGDEIDTENIKITSPYRNKKQIAGILVLSGITYGRSKNGKLYYKCIPDDIALPVFLVPYAEKSRI